MLGYQEGRREGRKDARKDSLPETAELDVAGPSVIGVDRVEAVVEDKAELAVVKLLHAAHAEPAQHTGAAEAEEEADENEPPGRTGAAVLLCQAGGELG